jgi:hypothetical protein
MVAVFGAGPAGLFAAQAAHDAGNVVRIYARGMKSTLYGAQYLHAPLPNLDCGDKQQIQYRLNGTSSEYRAKVYGADAPLGLSVSPDTLGRTHDAWDIRAAYNEAWERFSGLIDETEINLAWLRSFDDTARVDLVVWSLPLAPACLGGHQFQSQSVWAQGDAPDLGWYCSVNVEPWTVITNGLPEPRWYRASNVFGYKTAEWPDGPKPPIKGLARVNKPISTTCNCWSQLGGAQVLRVGRYGTWTKSEFSHAAYFRTRAAIDKM